MNPVGLTEEEMLAMANEVDWDNGARAEPPREYSATFGKMHLTLQRDGFVYTLRATKIDETSYNANYVIGVVVEDVSNNGPLQSLFKWLAEDSLRQYKIYKEAEAQHAARQQALMVQQARAELVRTGVIQKPKKSFWDWLLGK